MESTQDRTAQDAARKAKAQAIKEEQFAAWMRRDETKMLLSLIPQSQPPEATAIVLRSAFEAGHNSGGGEVASMFVEAMLKSAPKG